MKQTIGFTENELEIANALIRVMRESPPIWSIDRLLLEASKGGGKVSKDRVCDLCGTHDKSSRWWYIPNFLVHTKCICEFISRPEIQAHINFIS